MFEGRRRDLDGLLGESIEEFAPRGRGSPVEPEGKFVEVILKVVFIYRSLVCSEQPSFEQGNNAMNAGKDMFGVVCLPRLGVALVTSSGDWDPFRAQGSCLGSST